MGLYGKKINILTIEKTSEVLRTSLNEEDLVEMYRLMLLHRRFEEETIELFKRGVGSNPHVGLGHEGVAVGAYYKLPKDDLVLPHYRSRAAWFIRGVSVKTLMAENLMKKTSTTRGLYTYLHPWIPGILPYGSCAVGGFMSIAAGAALGAKMKKTAQVVVCGLGDGTADTGMFHESLNFASIWKLPIVFVMENNELCTLTPLSVRAAVKDLAVRAAGYGIPGLTIDGTDPIAVHKTVQEAVKRARNGEGPTLVECKCPRLGKHSQLSGDSRSEAEVKKLWKKDPLPKFEGSLIEKGILSKERIETIRREVQDEIEEAVRFAEESPDIGLEDYQLIFDVTLTCGLGGE